MSSPNLPDDEQVKFFNLTLSSFRSTIEILLLSGKFNQLMLSLSLYHCILELMRTFPLKNKEHGIFGLFPALISLTIDEISRFPTNLHFKGIQNECEEIVKNDLQIEAFTAVVESIRFVAGDFKQSKQN